MDRISELIQKAREINVWDTLSNEEVIEQALLCACCTSECSDCSPVVIEFISFEDDKEDSIKKRPHSRTC